MRSWPCPVGSSFYVGHGDGSARDADARLGGGQERRLLQVDWGGLDHLACISPWGLGSGNSDRPWLRRHRANARNACLDGP